MNIHTKPIETAVRIYKDGHCGGIVCNPAHSVCFLSNYRSCICMLPGGWEDKENYNRIRSLIVELAGLYIAEHEEEAFEVLL